MLGWWFFLKNCFYKKFFLFFFLGYWINGLENDFIFVFNVFVLFIGKFYKFKKLNLIRCLKFEEFYIVKKLM